MQDTRFATAGQRSIHRDALKPLLEQALSAFDGDALATDLMKIGVPAAPVQAVDAALDHPHTLHRGLRVDLPGYQGVGSPIKLSRTPPTYRHVPLTPGEHFE
ncbi:putative CoA-transferase [compost metagenome]